ncbi:L-histidine N(alpha)-methyltransferase [Bradyrhizobium sp. Ec3.3]|uniref:L-histidine N(alpha)-methyltransferase n=1 Tax=Bradyrhizobium sp. Ec3.3 TaxID=189753 RepID=UPI0012EB51D0|nr:L-histidine N(alpha)-methyltransferase [Bradyrhizobium sp. Ec3.3]
MIIEVLRLFEAITDLAEYYPTRTERSILSSCVTEIAALTGEHRVIVEFGSGSSAKTRILLSRAMENCPLGVMRNCPLLG